VRAKEDFGWLGWFKLAWAAWSKWARPGCHFPNIQPFSNIFKQLQDCKYKKDLPFAQNSSILAWL
jgi:hypothetical protein